MAQGWEEDKLIKKILSGEETQINAAASEMTSQYLLMVAKIVRIGGGQEDDIQMILNDAVLEIIKKIQNGTYDASLATLKTLLFTIAKNKWLDELDRRYRTKKSGDSDCLRSRFLQVCSK
jgi:DNA-directed RNA polymerase specialized sigma24 family protein